MTVQFMGWSNPETIGPSFGFARAAIQGYPSTLVALLMREQRRLS